MFSYLHRRCGQSRLRKSEINKISKIHPKSNSVGDEVEIKKKFLISFFCINYQRYNAEQNKQRINVKNCSCIKSNAVISQTKIVWNAIYCNYIFVKKPKQQSGNLIKKVSQKYTIKKSNNFLFSKFWETNSLFSVWKPFGWLCCSNNNAYIEYLLQIDCSLVK